MNEPTKPNDLQRQRLINRRNFGLTATGILGGFAAAALGVSKLAAPSENLPAQRDEIISKLVKQVIADKGNAELSAKTLTDIEAKYDSSIKNPLVYTATYNRCLEKIKGGDEDFLVSVLKIDAAREPDMLKELKAMLPKYVADTIRRPSGNSAPR